MRSIHWTIAAAALGLSTVVTTLTGSGCGGRAARDDDAGAATDGADASEGQPDGGTGRFTASDLSVASDGRIVVVGTIKGSVDLDGTSIVSAGGDDVVLATFSSSGQLVWARRFGDADEQRGGHVAVDAAGNIVVILTFAGQLDMGGGAFVSAGSADVCVAKLDAAGKHLWSHKFGGIGLESESGIAVDASGRVAAAANSSIPFDFATPGSPPAVAFSGYHSSVVALDPAGNLVWSKAWGGARVAAVSIGRSDAVLVAGGAFEPVDFGGGALASKGINDAYVVDLTPAGGHVWSRRFGGSRSDGAAAFDVAADTSGNVLLTGTFNGNLDISDPPLVGPTAPDHASTPTEIFVAKLDPGGGTLWGRHLGGASGNYSGLGVGIVATASGNVALTGSFAGSVDFGLGALDPEMKDYPSAFLLETDPAGVSSWNRRIPYGVTRVRSEASGRLLAAGSFALTAADLAASLRTLSTGSNAFLIEYAP